ncbi:uncharacterized protein FTJAE_1811 [Fusarium tjaetaba]|uniref:AB hydrolase-1 domain-containing protein n=1 Tax=Fusarium tjaetaba TaxID=1567544 RepID=A0A8H5S9F6_9HYPO|nr:uncharacterized protein FTJAE_1811 [Fusarium tjaetaba]KAF5646980.1 hypothetical protein FTJAE_1811 [Fusarium tjaetaba]
MSSERVVEFKTYDGLKLQGTFYAAGERRPCIIMTTGFSGERFQYLPDFARRFQAAGFGVLLYDNRNFGESEGVPRNEVDPDMQARDYFDAFNYATTLAEVDPSRIVYWGSSMSGGNVIKAAALNSNIAAVIAQVPFVSGDGLSRASRQPPATLVMERGNAVATGNPTMIPTYPELRDGAVHDNPGAVLAGPSAVKFIEEMVRRGYSWAETVTAQSVANCSLSEPLAYIHRISPNPLLMIVADDDTITDTRSQLEAFEKAVQPKKLLIMKGEDHFSVYFGDAFERNIAGQIDFLKETLTV